MDTYAILMTLSSLLIFSYLFEVFSRKTAIPTVLLLIATGIALRGIADALGHDFSKLIHALPLLGAVGLILIVLEGALDLRFEADNSPMVIKALAAAVIMLFSTAAIMAFSLMFFLGQSFQAAFVNAIPFCSISSAIVIPSIAHLSSAKRQFMVYETVFSDIAGIVIFNYAVTNSRVTIPSFLLAASEMALFICFSIAGCLLLLYLLGRITYHLKYFLLIGILTLLYSLGHYFHLSSLVLILSFGLLLNNADLVRMPIFRRYFIYEGMQQDIRQFHLFTLETSFLVRTLFFLAFGFTMDLEGLFSLRTAGLAAFGVAAIYSVRLICLRTMRMDRRPELYVAPRGLVNILLFLSIPAGLGIGFIDQKVLLMVLIATNLIMTFGLVRHKMGEQAVR